MNLTELSTNLTPVTQYSYAGTVKVVLGGSSVGNATIFAVAVVPDPRARIPSRIHNLT
jgi:hypothetical protein